MEHPSTGSSEAVATSRPGFFSRPFRFTVENLTWLAVAVGVLLRVWEYLEFRPLYMDEVSLLKNLIGKPAFDFHHILEDDQMAPPAFLVIERLLVRLPLDLKASGRLFPLVCGIASVFLMRRVSLRYLDRWAVPVAVAFFALGDHLLYYSAEIKQYSCDLLFALLGLLLAPQRPPGRAEKPSLAPIALFGLIAPWFSFSSIFVLAGMGLSLFVSALRERTWRTLGKVAAMGVGWLLSFGVCVALSRSILSQRDFIWVWWNFAFLPLPPRSMADCQLLVETLANTFIHPGSLLSPLPLPYTAAIASILATLGVASMGRRWPGGLFLVIAPLLCGLAASGLRQYPFHGRLLFYLVPTLLLLVAEGVAVVRRFAGLPAGVILAGFLVWGEITPIAWYKFMQPRSRTFDSHGDLKNDLLDYLEYERHRKPSPPSRP